MKKAFTLLAIAALTVSVFAQSPQKMSYQCVVRNSSGALVTNHVVGMKISILRGSATGTVVFSETYSPNPQTNANGLVTIEIGTGTATVGTFAGIDWSSGSFFLKTETDPSGGTSYSITGTSQLLSVPYALYAKTAANGFSGAWSDLTGKPVFATVATSGSYNDLLNKPTLFSGAWSAITGKPTTLAGYGITDADNSTTNEIQLLSLSDNILSLSNGGGSVTLPSSSGGLTLPYSGSSSGAGYSFSVTNTVSSAISGKSTATTGTYHGVYGESMSSAGTGVSGSAPYNGVYGQSSGYKGRGIIGEAIGNNSIGIMGLAISENSTGVWGEGANQGVYGKSDLTTGKGIFGQVTSDAGFSGYFDGGKFYVSGKVGIGTTTPSKKLHVMGSAQVRDTLYANVVNANKVTIMPGLANSIVGTSGIKALATTWTELNSVTINVPAAGYVLLIVSCDLGSIHTFGDFTQASLGVSETSDGTGVKETAYMFVSNSEGSEYINEHISFQAVMQIATSGSHTFYLMGKISSEDHTDEVHRNLCHLTALYFPVAYGVVE